MAPLRPLCGPNSPFYISPPFYSVFLAPLFFPIHLPQNNTPYLRPSFSLFSPLLPLILRRDFSANCK